MKPEYHKRFYAKHRTEKILASRDYHKRTGDAIISLLGGKCMSCGFSDIRALQIDHVNGGGAKEKRSITKNHYNFMLERIIKGTTDYQILCANCNWIKRVVNNENPRASI